MTQEYGSQPADEYGQPSYPPTAAYAQQAPSSALSGLFGKRRNPFAAWLGLPIITLGIYSLVYIYKTNKELGRYDSRIEVNPMLSVLAYFPGFLLLIPPFVASWRLGVRVQAAQHAAGVQESSPVLSFVLWWFGFGPLYSQFEINKIWDRYPGAVEGQQVPLAV